MSSFGQWPLTWYHKLVLGLQDKQMDLASPTSPQTATFAVCHLNETAPVFQSVALLHLAAVEKYISPQQAWWEPLFVSPAFSDSDSDSGELADLSKPADTVKTPSPPPAPQPPRAQVKSAHGARPSSWSADEEEACIALMQSPQVAHLPVDGPGGKWAFVSKGMAHQGYDRSPNAVKNVWNRGLKSKAQSPPPPTTAKSPEPAKKTKRKRVAREDEGEDEGEDEEVVVAPKRRKDSATGAGVLTDGEYARRLACELSGLRSRRST